jgi:hypothetical protein
LIYSERSGAMAIGVPAHAPGPSLDEYQQRDRLGKRRIASIELNHLNRRKGCAFMADST